MAAIPSKPSTPPAQDSTWLNWLYGLVFRQAQEVQNEENIPRDPLLVSEIFSNWQVVESPEDKLNSLKAKLEKQERAQELQQFKNRRKFTRALEFFVSAITMFSKDESHLLAHKIDPNSRAAIMSRIIASFQTMWFRTLESMFFKDAEHTLALAHAWKQFEDNYAETKYSKNILGSMKDIGTFIYHGANFTGLTAKIIMDIASRWTEILCRAMTEVMERNLSAEESETIEKMICDSLCGTIVRMHIDVAKKSGDALEREGRLPQQWEEENTKLKEKLASIREHGTADARYSEPSPITIESTPGKGRKNTVELLERMLQLRSK